MSKTEKSLSKQATAALLQLLQTRFEKNMNRHIGLKWGDVLERLQQNPEKLYVLQQMEETGGEPDVIGVDANTKQYLFCDCSPESPPGRRSTCYDAEGLLSRKEHRPDHSAVEMAEEIGISLLTPEEYRFLQQLGPFDTKTSSWLRTPGDIRALGGALFGDYRYGTVFIYHNGAQSYYAARGFRGLLRV